MRCLERALLQLQQCPGGQIVEAIVGKEVIVVVFHAPGCTIAMKERLQRRKSRLLGSGSKASRRAWRNWSAKGNTDVESPAPHGIPSASRRLALSASLLLPPCSIFRPPPHLSSSSNVILLSGNCFIFSFQPLLGFRVSVPTPFLARPCPVAISHEILVNGDHYSHSILSSSLFSLLFPPWSSPSGWAHFDLQASPPNFLRF